MPVAPWGAPTGFDSGDPRRRRYTERIAIEPTARNSDCQFCSVRSPKSAPGGRRQPPSCARWRPTA